MLAEMPYAEWYRNTMSIKGSPTWRHHRDVYGGAEYDDFISSFDDGTETCDVDGIAELAHAMGAGYVVLTTKHADGFALWPSSTDHPIKGRYHARRDLVGDLTNAVRARGMRMGLYYCGGYDWAYSPRVLRRAADIVLGIPTDDEYEDFVTRQYRELIDRYRPSVLWNDVAWPGTKRRADLMDQYYSAVPDGVVNDRWPERKKPTGRISESVVRLLGAVAEASWRWLPAKAKRLDLSHPEVGDFSTMEYMSPESPPSRKWELTRGVGNSFGANTNEDPDDYLSTIELVKLLCHVVADGGNLLVNVGPDERGLVSEMQAGPLRGLGVWLAENSEAIRCSQPWSGAPSISRTDYRFTTRDGDVYVLVLVPQPGMRMTLSGLGRNAFDEATLLAPRQRLDQDGASPDVSFRLPEGISSDLPVVVKLRSRT
jgi:alpha-L-fucosidase